MNLGLKFFCGQTKESLLLRTAHRNAEELASDIRGSIRGSISIGTYYSAATAILPPFIKIFSEEYPSIKVTMLEGRADELYSWLAERRVDMCLCPPRNEAMYKSELIAKDRIMAWLPEDHEFKGNSFPIKRFEKEKVILTFPGSGNEIDRLFEEEGIEIHEALSTKDEYTTYNLVEAGLGISINQEMVGSRWEGKVRILPVSPARYVEIGLVCPPENDMSPAAKKFAELLLDQRNFEGVQRR